MLELEDVVQCEVTRKRWRFLAHLPSTATFKLAEVGACWRGLPGGKGRAEGTGAQGMPNCQLCSCWYVADEWWHEP